MNAIIKWFFELNSNLVAFVSIILSGIISWAISAKFHNMGNRNNLMMSAIYPICSLLTKQTTPENYEALCDLSKEYSIRYMKKKEFKQLQSLQKVYHTAIRNTENEIYAQALFSYFEYNLRKHNIDFKFIPFEYNGEIVKYDFPEDLDYMYHELRILLEKNHYDSWDEFRSLNEDNLNQEIISIFQKFYNSFYPIIDMDLFDNFSLDKTLRTSKIVKKWEYNFYLLDIEKDNFKKLKICKSLHKSKVSKKQRLQKFCTHFVLKIKEKVRKTL